MPSVRKLPGSCKKHAVCSVSSRDRIFKHNFNVGTSADERGGRKADWVAHVFVFFSSIIIRPLCRFTLSDQAQAPPHLKVSFSDLV